MRRWQPRAGRGYVARHVELGYATTAYGAQGATTHTAHVVIGEQTGAAAAYVGMTRGRAANTAHLVADSIDDARAQWVAVFGRDRADLGPAAAVVTARADLARYGHQPDVPPLRTAPGGDLITALRRAWNVEATHVEWLQRAQTVRDQLRAVADLRRQQAIETAPLHAAHAQATAAARAADAAVAANTETMTTEAEQLRRQVQAAWDAEQPAAGRHAITVLTGPGRFGIHTLAVNRSAEELARWAVRWQPILPAVPTVHREIARYAAGHTNTPPAHEQIQQYATAQVAARHPEHQLLTAAAHTAHQHADHTARQLHQTETRYAAALARHGNHAHTPNAAARLADLEPDITARQETLQTTRDTITRLETALRARRPLHHRHARPQPSRRQRQVLAASRRRRPGHRRTRPLANATATTPPAPNTAPPSTAPTPPAPATTSRHRPRTCPRAHPSRSAHPREAPASAGNPTHGPVGSGPGLFLVQAGQDPGPNQCQGRQMRGVRDR